MLGNQLLARPVRQVVAMMCATGWAHLELPAQLMPDNDPDLAMHLAGAVLGLLDARLELSVAGEPPRLLQERGIAVGVTHNSQVNAVQNALRRLCVERGRTLPAITVQTANKIQGREFDVTLVWHPLSGRRDASEFHLDAGRSCVLLSRHRFGCIVVSRGGISQQLFDSPSSDDQYSDTEAQVDGWLAQSRVLERLAPYVVPA